MHGNFMASEFSMKPHLIRNRLSVNNINKKLITGLQITFTADDSLNEKILFFLIPELLSENDRYSQ